MAAYTKIRETRIQFSRGVIVQRHYDKLSVDFLAHNLIRTSVRALKIDKEPFLYPLTRELTLPLVRQFNDSEMS